MTLSFGIIFIAMCIFFLIGMAVSTYSKPKPKQIQTLKSEPQAIKASEKTVQQILQEVLIDPPTGCMWEVEKAVKHYRKMSNGRYLFDGTYDVLFAKVKLITPFGDGENFSLKIDDLITFEKALKFNAEICLKKYQEKIKMDDEKKKYAGEGWDGIYS